MKKVLGVSGSLRADSTNNAVIRAMAKLAPDSVDFTLYDGLATIPPFNPTNDKEEIPLPVQELRRLIKEADAVVICTPEYAFGMPGVLKNALDWLVSSAELMHKPVAAISASPSDRGGELAHASLVLTLTALTATIFEEAKIIIPFVRKKINEQGELTDTATLEKLSVGLNTIIS